MINMLLLLLLLLLYNISAYVATAYIGDNNSI